MSRLRVAVSGRVACGLFCFPPGPRRVFRSHFFAHGHLRAVIRVPGDEVQVSAAAVRISPQAVWPNSKLPPPDMKILMIDIGGSNVKMMVEGCDEMRKFTSGRTLTARQMVSGVKKATRGWEYDAITLGFPGLVEGGKLVREPLNLSGGWMNFNFAQAFRKPVRIINDAAMQALANYEAGRLLFVGLGTSVGAALIADDTVVPLEIGTIPLSKSEAMFERLGKKGLHSHGRQRWQKSVERAVLLLRDIFWPDHFQLGGGNAKYLDPVPEGCLCGSNRDAFYGAERLWPGADMLAEIETTTLRITRNVQAMGGK